MFFLDIADDIKWWVGGAIRGLFATLCQFVYMIMSWLWELLMDVSKIRLLNSGGCSISGDYAKRECLRMGAEWVDSPITLIYKRFTLLLGIIMTFYIIFQFIKYLMTPEEIEDKEKGIEKLGFKLLTVVVLLAITPTLFDTAYEVQNVILEKQILSKIVVGKSSIDNTTFGRDFSASLLSNFYYAEGQEGEIYNDGNIERSDIECEGTPCNYVVLLTINELHSHGTLNNLNYGLNEHGTEISGIDDYYIHFDGLFALVVGVFITYMLVMYTIDVGARVIQLTFLQIIAPIPIITYLSPKKDGTFQKWTKQCMVTYIDLFIRLIIIYFTVLLIEAVGTAYHSGEWMTGMDQTSSLPFFIYLVLILGLMMFCKRAPKMVQELFPAMGTASGTFGLKAGERVPEAARRVTGAAIAGAAGAAIGLGTGFAQGIRAGKRNGLAGFGKAMEGAVVGTVGGATRGLYNGSKKGNMVKNIGTGIKNQTAANRRFGNRAESGYSWRDQISDSARQAFNAPTRVEEIEKKKAPIKAQKDAYDNLTKTNDSIREHAFKKAKDNGLKSYVEYAAAEGRHKRLQEDRQYINAFVDKDSNGRVTARGEQSTAYKNAMAAAVQDMKKYKDIAINEYIDSKVKRDKAGNVVFDKDGVIDCSDGKLKNLMQERNESLENYNKYASINYKIKGSKKTDSNDSNAVEIELDKKDSSGNVVIGSDGKPVKETKKVFIEDMTAEEYDAYIKQIASDESGSAGRKISNLDKEEQDIKDTIEGSGIPGGKK